MEGELLTTTFPSREELERALSTLEALGCSYLRIDPTPPLSRVALSALVMSRETRARLAEQAPGIILSGWVEHRTANAKMPEGPAPEAPGACFQGAAIMVLQPCVADDTKIRLTAHVRGDLGPVLPYLNTVMQTASYTPTTETLAYMDRYRMIVLYPRRITIAKADEIVDAWLILERICILVEDTWNRRGEIEPCYETRKRPPALEIYRRLPGTNCGRCGEMTCMAFALRLWAGEVRVRQCTPVFLSEHETRRSALLEICSGLGIRGEVT
jgi:ArsR family metal-binding transcriptional regulator